MVDSRVTIDEAVEYGFHMLLGIFKYLILMGILAGIAVFLSFSEVCMSYDSNIIVCSLIPLVVMLLISCISLALSIGIAYKLIADASD